MAVFESLGEALAAGYVAAAKREYTTYRGCAVIGVQKNMWNRGCAPVFLRVEVPEEFTRNYLGVTSEWSFGESMRVEIKKMAATDLVVAQKAGLGKRFGSELEQRPQILHMFSPREFDGALKAAYAWTDQWMELRNRKMGSSIVDANGRPFRC